MAMADRTANTVWEGDLAHGNGTLSAQERRDARAARHVGLADRALRRQDEPGGAPRGRAFVVLLDGALARADRGRPQARAASRSPRPSRSTSSTARRR